MDHPKKAKSIPTYESQHFSGVVTVDPETKKNRVRINDQRGYAHFLNQKCKAGDEISVYYTNKKPKRTELQHRYYFQYLSLIGLSCGHTADELNIWVKGKFLSKGITEVFGMKVRRVKSATELNISEFCELIERIESETGIPAPATDLFKKPHSHEEHRKLKEDQKSLYESFTPLKQIKI